jgi:hypothetical protein
MRRLLAAWVLCVLAAGCVEVKKPAEPPGESQPNPAFDKNQLPKGAKGTKDAKFG